MSHALACVNNGGLAYVIIIMNLRAELNLFTYVNKFNNCVLWWAVIAFISQGHDFFSK